jgi:hypothetical protein
MTDGEADRGRREGSQGSESLGCWGWKASEGGSLLLSVGSPCAAFLPLQKEPH